MDTLKDLKKAESHLTGLLEDSRAFKTESYRQRERHFYQGVNQFLSASSKRSRFFSRLAKGLLATGVVSLAATTAIDASTAASMVNGSFLALGAAGGALASGFNHKKQLTEAKSIKQSVDELRDDRFNFGLNNLKTMQP